MAVNKITPEFIGWCAKNVGMEQGSNDWRFAHRVLSADPKKYQKRVHQLGYRGLNSVLDAGSGFGQWSLALAKANDSVIAFDADPVRVDFLRLVCRELEIENIEVHHDTLGSFIVPDSSVDGVFCYGTIFLGDWLGALSRFHDALRPGGLLYVNANDIGWYLYLRETRHNATFDYKPGDSLLEAACETLSHRKGLRHEGKHLIISPSELRKALVEIGYERIVQDREGLINRPRFMRLIRKDGGFLLGRYKGFIAVHEALSIAQKSRICHD